MEQNRTQLAESPARYGQDEIDLSALFSYYLSRWYFVLAGLLAGVLIAGAVTYFLIVPKYTATSKLYMVSNSSDSIVNLSDLNIGTSLSNDYKELLKVRPILEEIAEEEGLPYTYEQLSGMVSISTIANTRILVISVTSKSPKEAQTIANALAAKATYGAPVIVVDFGTATNIDVVDATGAFRGGAIMPGLLLSANALFSRAAKLSSVPLVVPPHALGDSTETAVQSGVVIGAATQIEGLVERIQRELAAEGDNIPRATVVGTGGYSETIAEATEIFDALDPDITIRGIYQIWAHAVEKHAARVQ